MRTSRTIHLEMVLLGYLFALIFTPLLSASPGTLGKTLQGETCKDLSRMVWDKYPYHLAVRVDNHKWRLIAPNGEPTSLKAHLQSKTRDLQFCWAVPAAPKESAQIVYVHTRYSQNQPISLHRNTVEGPRGDIQKGFFATIKDWFEGSYTGWQDYLDISGCQFKNYHETKVSECRGTEVDRWKNSIDKWHSTGAWETHIPTREFTKQVVKLSLKDQKIASERLLRLNPNRDLMSWIYFRSNPPGIGQCLVLKLTYSLSSAVGSDLKVHSFKVMLDQSVE